MAYLNTPKILEQYAAMLMVMLPEPRLDFYESPAYAQIKANVETHMNELTDAVGLYPVATTNALLSQMQIFSFALLFIGLVFNILLIIFVIISVLLIYSLLMITTETKTFDTGVMRLLGLTSKGFVAMILTQGIMFVLPSIISAYISAYPILYLLFMKVFKNDLSSGAVSIVPGW